MTFIQCAPKRTSHQVPAGLIRFSDLFEDLFSVPATGRVEGITRPRANVTENQSDFLLELLIPGYLKTDLRIGIENGELQISGEMKKQDVENSRLLRKEFSISNFERRFELPENVDSEKIQASYENGILFITLPKKADAVKKTPVSIHIN